MFEQEPCLDYFIGSIHHAAGVGIDFDREMYVRAQEVCGGTEEKLFETYFDEQFEMLKSLKPKIVGHFDLVRLLSENPGRDLSRAEWRAVWDKVVRNLEFVVGYGGWLECNTSALRKGLDEPYPARPIAEVCFSVFFTFIFPLPVPHTHISSSLFSSSGRVRSISCFVKKKYGLGL